VYTRHLLQVGQRQAGLTLSEIMTILVHCHCSHYRTFKPYSNLSCSLQGT
jgi:hypothetical protein